MPTDQGEKILLYQDLYSRYSSLGLSRPPDRAIGIAGLEARILTTLNVVGGFGILDDSADRIQGGGLLRRSLLWCRAAEVDNLRCIAFSREDGYPIVPSWSWMAYSGAIDYIKPEFGAMEWDDMQSPWVSSSPDVSIRVVDNTKQYPVLIALARDFNAQLSRNNQSNFILDSPDNWQDLPTKCVILGKLRGRKSENEKLHYVLLVTEMENEESMPDPIYRRVGVGILPGKCVMPDAIRVSIR